MESLVWRPILACLVTLSGCGGGGISGDTVTASTTITGQGTPIANLQGSAEGLNAALHRDCLKDVISCLTPSTMAGTFGSLALRVSAGGNQYARLVVVEPDADGSHTFDFQVPTAIPGTFECCDGKTWGVNDGSFKDLQWTLASVDATLVDPLDLVGTFTLRLVYQDDAALGYKRGDVLLRDSDGAFRWCQANATSAADCSLTRPTDPVLQDADIVDFVPDPGDGGSQSTLPYITAEVFPDATGNGIIDVGVDAAGFADVAWNFAVDFDTTGAFAVMQSSPGDSPHMANVADLMGRVFLRGLSATPAATKDGAGGSKVGVGIASVLTTE